MTLTPTKIKEEYAHPKFFLPVETVEKHWIERSRNNIADFIMYMTDGDFYIPDHHIEWLFHLLSPAPEDRLVNIIAYRGSAKTFILVHTLAWMIGKYPINTNAIFSSNGDLSEARLREVRDLIETNPRYRNVFPWIHIDEKRKNNAKQFTVWSSQYQGKEIEYGQWRRIVERKGQPRDATLFSVGITASGVAGRRFTGMVLLDDIHDAKNSATPQQRFKIVNVVKGTVMPCMWKHAKPKIVSISTRWAEDDFPGTVAEEKRRNGQKIWKTISVPVVDEDGNPTWKELWTLEKVEEAREEYGEVMFQLMFMNNPKAATLGEFTLDMFRVPLPEHLPTFKEIGVSCDFAHTETNRADYTVFIAYAKDLQKPYNYYILDSRRFKRTQISSKIDDLIEFADQIFNEYEQLDTVLMEKNDSAGEYQDLLTKRPDIPAKVVATKGDKESRLKPFATVAQQHRLYINDKMKEYNALVSEFLAFPSPHDDFCDAGDLPFQQTSWQQQGQVRSKVHRIQSPHMI